MKQYYINKAALPKEILVEEDFPEENDIAEFLGGEAGRTVTIHVPERGAKRALLKLAQKDLEDSMRTLEERVRTKQEHELSLVKELSAVVGRDLTGASPVGPRLEAYDISHTGGADSVGAMVVFRGDSPARDQYRRFRIKPGDAGDDYASMQEVLYRRFMRAKAGDPGFSELPDLLLIDGGLGHVHAAEQVMDAIGMGGIAVAGMVKDDRHRTRGLIHVHAAGGDTSTHGPAAPILPDDFAGTYVRGTDESGYTETDLKKMPELYHLIGRIQEEVHRFAIEYHRGVRKSHMSHSELDEIPGIGAKRRNALLMRFGGIDGIKAASEADLASTPGMNAAAAKAVFAHFRHKC
jgi:excinuclease ABC subunit C